jgi:hypothetical protein
MGGGGGGGGGITTDVIAEGVSRVPPPRVSYGIWGKAPQEIFKIWVSEIAFPAFR